MRKPVTPKSMLYANYISIKLGKINFKNEKNLVQDFRPIKQVRKRHWNCTKWRTLEEAWVCVLGREPLYMVAQVKINKEIDVLYVFMHFRFFSFYV